ncbi:MAG TPA: Hsp20/alpha crystallin family protein [Verrucomicrobiae bacterium]|nr:Hsp20/alpha crystallin family protein [Verrucomicrobiae bacterium]
MKLTRRQRDDRGTLAPYSPGGFSPLGELNRIRGEINRLIERPFERPFDLVAPAASFFGGWEPAVDVYEDKDQITIKAELPGMKKEEIDISLHGNTLTVSGERKHEEEREEGGNYRSERYFGRFQRSVTLPQPVDAARIQARYRDGILTIICPKTEDAKPKQIQIKTN